MINIYYISKMAHIFILLSFFLITSGYAQNSAWQQILLNGDSIESEISATCDDYKGYRQMEQDAAKSLRSDHLKRAEELSRGAWQLSKESKCLQNLEKIAHFNYVSALGVNKKYKEADVELGRLEKKLASTPKQSFLELKQAVMINQIINDIQLGHYNKAENLLLKFLNHFPEDKDKAARLLSTILNLYIQKNKFTEAKTISERYQEHFTHEIKNKSNAPISLLLALAKLEEGLGNHEKFKSLLDEIDNNQKSEFSDNEKLELQFLRIKSNFYEYQKTKNCDSLEIIQKQLGALLESLEKNKFNLEHSADIEAAARLHEPIYTLLFETILSTHEDCPQENSIIAFWAMELYKRNEIPIYSSANQNLASYKTESVKTTLKKFLKKIPSENHALIYWYTGRHSAYALIVSKLEMRLVRINDISQILKNIEDLNSGIQNFNIKQYLKSETWQFIEKRNFQDLSYAIYEKLIIPLHIEQYDHWHISPDIGLHSLPFDILIRRKTSIYQTWSQLDYLIKDYNINYFTHFDQFCQTKSLKNTENAILSIQESNLKATESPTHAIIQTKEVDFLLSKFKVTKRLDLDFPTPKSFWTEAENYNILHFALHGRSNERENALIFQGFNLTDNEIRARKLNCELVVLATCQSSNGREGKGINPESILQAFRSAGVNNLIAMKWDAEDESTAAILERFYFYLGEGWDKPNALRKAKLDFFEGSSDIKTHPFFWAGADVFADFESTNFKVADFEIRKAIIFFGIPIILLSLLLYKKKTSHINF